MPAKAKVKYQGQMDQECIPLCDAINRIPGLRTIGSCCGHGERTFKIWFTAKDLEWMPQLVYWIDNCHVGFDWDCKVQTDCGMSPVTFCLESRTLGGFAYQEADLIAKHLNDYLDTI